MLFVRSASLATLFFVLLSCRKNGSDPAPGNGNAALYFPPNNNTEWAGMKADSMGWNTAELPALYNYLQTQGTRAFLVLKNGKIVLEQYWNTELNSTQPFTRSSTWYWASAGKTLTAFTVGMAQQQGKLNIGSPTRTYLGNGWTSAPAAKEALITVRHQLTMTTGLNDGVANSDNADPQNLQYLADAGTRWAYHNAPYTLLQSVVARATGQNYYTYFNQQLRNLIGMDGLWVDGGDNVVYHSTGRSMARFGLLMLAGGQWNGTVIQPDAAYMKALVTPSQSINQSYGYLWWLNGQSSYHLPQTQQQFSGSMAPDAPADLVSGLGKDGQLVCVVPSQQLVVIRMGSGNGQGLVSMPLQNEVWRLLGKVIR